MIRKMKKERVFVASFSLTISETFCALLMIKTQRLFLSSLVDNKNDSSILNKI
jgi:hypothetical protein